MTPIIGAAFLPHPPILIPEIGRGNEREASETQTGFHQVIKQIEALQPNVAVVLTPHGRAGEKLLAVNREPKLKGTFAAFGHPEIRFEAENALPLAEKLLRFAEQHHLPVSGSWLSLDHGALVPLYLMKQQIENVPVLHLSVGWESLQLAFETGRKLGDFLDDVNERILLLSSGDLSHRLKEDGPYGFHPKGPAFDHMVRDAFTRNRLKDLKDIPDQLSEPAGQCGLVSFVITAGILEQLQTETKLYSYEGPYGVGYLCAFTAVNQTTEHHTAVKLAFDTIRQYLKEGSQLNFEEYMTRYPEDSFLKEALRVKAGAFVSLHSGGKLRGCIGTIEAVQEHLGNEIIVNAIQAATEDPRFSPVHLKELKNLDVKVDVMGNLESVDGPDELDVQIYGVVVESGYRRGLLLPALDGVQTVEQQLSIVCQKAGIPENEPFKISRFTVTRYK
ncbi:MAG: AmmeMemoRadiSam system protein A [Bacillota bacterium]|nr:AmmeMemoRadiSam system protein A [Bacillota bacterium]MDW7676984.1 AmmeMemoRadiSam system protein A [Bacillota bacterium]